MFLNSLSCAYLTKFALDYNSYTIFTFRKQMFMVGISLYYRRLDRPWALFCRSVVECTWKNWPLILRLQESLVKRKRLCQPNSANKYFKIITSICI